MSMFTNSCTQFCHMNQSWIPPHTTWTDTVYSTYIDSGLVHGDGTCLGGLISCVKVGGWQVGGWGGERVVTPSNVLEKLFLSLDAHQRMVPSQT